MWWLLSREVLRLRGVLARDQRWDVVVDLFFYRDPEESEKEEQQAKEQVLIVFCNNKTLKIGQPFCVNLFVCRNLISNFFCISLIFCFYFFTLAHTNCLNLDTLVHGTV